LTGIGCNAGIAGGFPKQISEDTAADGAVALAESEEWNQRARQDDREQKHFRGASSTDARQAISQRALAQSSSSQVTRN